MFQQIRSVINAAWGRSQTFIKERPDKYSREFIAHNRKVWGDYRSDRSQGEILIEANNMGGCVVAQSYLGSYLGRQEKARLVAFTKTISRSNKAVYGSFVDSFLFYSAEPYVDEIDVLLVKNLSLITSKRNLDKLCIDDIWIGDLIYDEFIRRLDTTTVDLSSPEFPHFIRSAIGYLVFWKHYFRTHRVKAVLISHCVYPWAGIIARVAIHYSVPVYLAQPNKIYYVTESHNSRAYNQYIDYPEQFAQLTCEKQEKGLLEAKEGVARRLSGKRDVGGYRLINTPNYGVNKAGRVLKENAKIKVLVASHCFSDNNHVFGNNLFPDIYEWLCFVGEMSARTDYDWYIKLHPDRYPWETEHIEKFVRRFPKFTILDSSISHHQIFADGINCALTIYGTIAFEYAALGIPVITAAHWNPTVAYDFNLHPKTVEEYKRTLLNLHDITLNIDMDKVYEYYFCNYLDEPDNWLYESFERLDYKIGGGRAHIGSLSYKKFLDQFTPLRHEQILATINTFIQSEDYCLRPCHVVSP